MQIAEARVKLNESVVCADLEDGAVLLNVENGVYFGLDVIGTAIWKMLEEGVSPEDIIDRLFDEYEVERTQLQADVTEFLAQLGAGELVQR